VTVPTHSVVSDIVGLIDALKAVVDWISVGPKIAAVSELVWAVAASIELVCKATNKAATVIH